MSKPMRNMLIAVFVVFGLIFGWYFFKLHMFHKYMASYTPPPVTISAVKAEAKTWQSYYTSVGTLKAVNGVDVSAEVPGIVSEIHFKSGDNVQKGAVLISFETSVEQATLKNDEAQLNLMHLNYDRTSKLAKKSFSTQADLDTALANYQSAQSQVDSDKAKIEQKSIKAPFAGKIGISLINLGQFVAAGTGMVTLQALDPLLVQFSLPEQDLPALALNQTVELTVNAYGDKPFIGKVTAINSKIDQATRSVLVEATIPNSDNHLYPGMFASARVLLPQQNQVITLPQTAVSFSLHGDSVYLIKEKGKDDKDNPILHAERQYVTTGERRGSEIAILKGIKVGDLVVTSGQLKLQNGAVVTIDNSVEL